jgi:predicted nuclease of predicted toxin-antitoxin system
MRLLFDQNLSPRLVERLSDVYPGSAHIADLALDRADDDTVWQYARSAGYTIVTKDADFGEISVIRGFPPKVVWLRIGNCTTAQIATLLRTYLTAIESLEDDPEVGLLALL